MSLLALVVVSVVAAGCGGDDWQATTAHGSPAKLNMRTGEVQVATPDGWKTVVAPKAGDGAEKNGR